MRASDSPTRAFCCSAARDGGACGVDASAYQAAPTPYVGNTSRHCLPAFVVIATPSGYEKAT